MGSKMVVQRLFGEVLSRYSTSIMYNEQALVRVVKLIKYIDFFLKI